MFEKSRFSLHVQFINKMSEKRDACFEFIIRISTYNYLFKHFKQRYSKEQMNLLNTMLRNRRKLHNLKISNALYKDCILNRVAPKFIISRIEKSGVKCSPIIEKSFLNDEIRKQERVLNKIKNTYRLQLTVAETVLTRLDFLRFLKFLSFVVKKLTKEKLAKNQLHVSRLVRLRFGESSNPSHRHIINLSDYKLNDTEQFVLSHGLNFCLPPKQNDICREDVFSEFEIFAAQLAHHTPNSMENVTDLKARLTDIAHSYCGLPVNSSDFKMRKECFLALRNLKTNDSIKILKPDKGSGAVILNTGDYISKMENILNDESKFTTIGPAEIYDKTSTTERKLQKFLLKLTKDEELLPNGKKRKVMRQLTEADYKAIRPTGSQRPRLYGLPKVHKNDVPLRPILSMINSAQHKLAKWLVKLLEPVIKFYTVHCVKDTFTFVDSIRQMNFKDINTPYMVSFDAKSLFTNIPLKEAIRISADALFEQFPQTTILTKTTFIELMETATNGIEFSFNNTIYRQHDGVAMGSPLGPALANIFVGFYERQLFSTTSMPLFYKRYVDDTFVLFQHKEEVNKFHDTINQLHPNLKFTVETEENGKLSFLDVLLEKSTDNFVTSVYRKPTFTGQYIRWDSFCDKRRKVNLILTLTHRALKICSQCKLGQELDKITNLLIQNGYPEQLVISVIKRKVEEETDKRPEGPHKCKAYLRLPYIGSQALESVKRRIKQVVTKCYNTVVPQIVTVSKRMLPIATKDVLPIQQRSKVIYQFKCDCGSSYIGRTGNSLAKRIEQHAPANFRMKLTDEEEYVDLSPSSAIGQHLLENPACAQNFKSQKFTILAQARSDFHLKILEALYIMSKSPKLCRQKKFVYTCLLF